MKIRKKKKSQYSRKMSKQFTTNSDSEPSKPTIEESVTKRASIEYSNATSKRRLHESSNVNLNT